jgi:predicted nucleic acid-binding protein
VIFVDTSAWFARYIPTEADHVAARNVISATRPESLVTSDFVLDETLTLFQARGEFERAREVGRRMLEQSICRLVRVEEGDIVRAWTVFAAHCEQGWSFTDCTSRVIMQRLGIKSACAFDDHFRQFGDIDVLP